jgi:hypothetical protein
LNSSNRRSSGSRGCSALSGISASVEELERSAALATRVALAVSLLLFLD